MKVLRLARPRVFTPHRRPAGCRLFDTQLPPPISAWPIRWKLFKLVKEVLDIKPVDETRSDWLQQPLTEMQICATPPTTSTPRQIYLALDARELSEENAPGLLEDGSNWSPTSAASDPLKTYREVKLGWRLRATTGVLRELCAPGARTSTPAQPAQPHAARTHPRWPLARLLPENKTDLAAIEDMRIRAPYARTATSSSN